MEVCLGFRWVGEVGVRGSWLGDTIFLEAGFCSPSVLLSNFFDINELSTVLCGRVLVLWGVAEYRV